MNLANINGQMFLIAHINNSYIDNFLIIDGVKKPRYSRFF